MDSFTIRVKKVLKRIPRGQVATYGQIAEMAGSPRGARQVVWILHSSAEKEKLPWFRVVNSGGKIALQRGDGYELQMSLLEREGVRFSINGLIDLAKYQWQPKIAVRRKTPSGENKTKTNRKRVLQSESPKA